MAKRSGAQDLDLDAIAAHLDADAADMNLSFLEIRLGTRDPNDPDDSPAEMSASNSGGPLVWIYFHPTTYPALSEHDRAFSRRHELAHAYFCAMERIHERMIRLIRETNPDLAKEFDTELGQAEEDICDLLARAFTKRER